MRNTLILSALCVAFSSGYAQEKSKKYNPKAADVLDKNLPSGYRTDNAQSNSSVNLEIAKLSDEETEALEAIRGSWKRPLYENIDPKYQEEWDYIRSYEIPEWVLDAKFGVYTHWGVYSVPAFEGNTYIQNMYTPASRKGRESELNELTYNHHIKTYGDPTEFGYTDFVPMFKAEKYDPEFYVELMQAMGAKFGGLGVVHHDGFLMWDSDINRWNAGDMGPKRDLFGEFVEAAKKADFKTVATFHLARAWEYPGKEFDETFYTAEQKAKLDLFDPEYADFFWGMSGNKEFDIERFAQEWKDKIKEVTHKYSPDLYWFDGIKRTSENSPENYVVEVLSDYLKTVTSNGQEPVLCNKLPSGGKTNYCYFNFPEGTGLRCYEGGRNMPPDAGNYWLVDRAISYPWSYIHNKNYRLKADAHIRAIADQTARGGIYLLSLTPMASGEIHPEELEICYGIGEWMKVNGEAIYATRRWEIPAEGPVTLWRLSEGKEGIMWNFNKTTKQGETRFTRSKDGKTIYSILLYEPTKGKAQIKSLSSTSPYLKGQKVKNVTMLGSDEKLQWRQTVDALEVDMPKELPCEHAYSLKIEL